MAKNSIKIFYEGNGKIRAVTRIQDIKASVENNVYTNR
jgi:acetylglutamate synthase